MSPKLSISKNKKQLAILIDPEKTQFTNSENDLIKKINLLSPDFIFVGGSTVTKEELKSCIAFLKNNSNIPIIIFPGSHQQVDENADAILFLSLISGRNPDYLIGHQVQSARTIKSMGIQTISTAYMLIDGGKNSSVAYVSQTTPIPSDQISIAVDTAVAGETIGFEVIFMDAGSGAIQPISPQMIASVKMNINIPLIIGGGVRTIEDLENAYKAGADLVVIGNKIEEDDNFLLDLVIYKKEIQTFNEENA
ncbi:geranylgeranylglyceryl/heptaprenylglyceryl phosphate synthase [Paracrocinitomix mangrovi]|uniref:geranylgeranylglyceryl/heptaprenylglyceryl phosphate synthase n=1 Tax=Paracrocinitomix mangrovi TaxID=2862509 RepID=UPI001C8DBC1E|nr:geranylgeranylglyceryl/heptaprenylglyceryl phosphate synthase [Paracrocinitomix mangrovi]UKN03573.1 geranylgeranylglyceryl/heptaprenylglyceryl phosphate synthase [Paracrocinitomix mangrovi]